LDSGESNKREETLAEQIAVAAFITDRTGGVRNG